VLCFNTSHVVVYQFFPFWKSRATAGFNTSHVVVYRKVFSIDMLLSPFQYISCCSLSMLFHKIFIIQIMFQYISCCSLSCCCKAGKRLIKVSIHLML